MIEQLTKSRNNWRKLYEEAERDRDRLRSELDRAQSHVRFHKQRADYAFQLVKERGLKIAEAFQVIRELRADAKRLIKAQGPLQVIRRKGV